MKKSYYYIIAVMATLSSSLSVQGAINAKDQVIKSDSLLSEKQRWLANTNLIESLLRQNAAYLHTLKDKGAKPETRWLDEADELIKQFESEDRTNPAADSIMQEFDIKHHIYTLEMQRQKNEMEAYSSKYNRFAISFGVGRFYLFQESEILYNYNYNHYIHSSTGGYTNDFSFDTSGHFSKNSKGFSISGTLIWFLKENVFLELNYMYASSHTSPVDNILHFIPSPYSNPQITANDYYISTYSTNLIGSYFIKITPGLESIFGLGFTYIQNDAPAYICHSQDATFSAASYFSEFWAILFRVGFEFPLSNKKSLTLQLLCDGRVPLSSSYIKLPLSLQPHFRFVWHL